ncbi:MAG TPA: ADOP family duplicated permease [Gemmatimonadaceae bacterium]|nr:ADOP family duplicated permease [Gemmatimonadaceae bacterium]
MSKLLNLLPWIRRRKERELERELRYHLDRRVDELRAAGVSEADARRRAAHEFGGVAQVQEAVRDVWIHRWLDDLGRDVRYAIRGLARRPGFTATALLSLALGIGASTAILSQVDQLLLRRLPVHEPGRLVQLAWVGNSLSATWGGGHLLSYPLCRELETRAELFDGVLCRAPTTVSLSTGSERQPVRAELVSGSYFEVLGVAPELGRLLDRSDDREPGGQPVAVLSHAYWQSRLGGAPDVVGSRVLVDDRPVTVVGIAPARFVGLDPLAPTALWLPAMATPQVAPLERGWDRVLDRRAAWLHVIARLAPDVSMEEARRALRPWFRATLDADTRRPGFPAVAPDERRAFLASTLDVLPAARGMSSLRGALERPLLVVAGGTLLLLLLSSLNVGGLLLARGAARRGELATRMAMGASRRRVAGQLLVESSLLALGGGVLGLLAAPVLSRVLLSLLTWSDDLRPHVDLRTLLLALLASALAAALCGLAPVLHTGRVSLIASLREQSRSATRGGVALRKALVVGQLALTLLLLTGAGLFVQSLARLHANVGFDGRGLALFSLDPASIGHDQARAERAMREVLRRVREIPGVTGAAVANTTMLTGGWSTRRLTIQADERIVPDRPVPYMRVGADFFRTLGAPVVAGRDFDARDVRAPGEAPRPWRSAIVNESFVRRYLGGRSPVGHRLGVGAQPGTATDIEIVGVVRDFSRRSLRDEDVPQVFFPYWDHDSGDGAFYVRVRGAPESAFAAIRAAVAQVDPALPVSSLRTYADQVDRATWTERALARLVTAFGVTALLLSIVGLYGVMSFVVTQRRRELGVRLALGATRPAAVWLVVRDAVLMIGAGTAIALPAAWALGRLVEAQLYGIRAVAAPTIAAASGALALAALVAALVPAWRAASTSPTEALRLE